MPNTVKVVEIDHVREKLIEILADNATCLALGIKSCDECAYGRCKDCYTEALTDHLIANGVTVQKWIPVTERLPEDGENVLVYNDDNSEDFIPYFTGYFHGGVWYSSYALYEEENFLEVPSIVTHWMPLPEPPKGE